MMTFEESHEANECLDKSLTGNLYVFKNNLIVHE
jgi:hypothetical protein